MRTKGTSVAMHHPPTLHVRGQMTGALWGREGLILRGNGRTVRMGTIVPQGTDQSDSGVGNTSGCGKTGRGCGHGLIGTNAGDLRSPADRETTVVILGGAGMDRQGRGTGRLGMSRRPSTGKRTRIRVGFSRMRLGVWMGSVMGSSRVREPGVRQLLGSHRSHYSSSSRLGRRRRRQNSNSSRSSNSSSLRSSAQPMAWQIKTGTGGHIIAYAAAFSCSW